MPVHPSTKRRILWALAVFPAYLAALFFGDTRLSGNPFELGLAHGIFFGIIISTIFYPLLVMLQAGIHQLVRRLTRSTWPSFSPWEFTGIALLSLLTLSAFLRTSDTAYYRRFVSDEVPASLHGFQSRHWSGFGNGRWAVSLRIAPAEFAKVISRHEYVQESIRKPFRELTANDPELHLDLPDEFTSEVYSYSKPGPEGGLSIAIWTNADHDLVLLLGSRD